ncbi:YbhB/YbcL family Raf kinase inhibitor-like protein [Candidatus Woesearchaeota archaeon]|nr:YbhB/YbcL family Raf kinase inhibitor-like protein [Candidatus Woesearchaeota archaeon]
MKLASSAFENEGNIPSEFTCDGDDVSPPLAISDVPENTKSFALVCDDPDAPVGNWDHWIVWNIQADTREIAKATDPKGVDGKNSWGRTGYGGPCPPSGTHRYFFKLYALDTELGLEEGSGKDELEKAMEGNILAKAELMGKYQRK